MFCPVCKAEYRAGYTHCTDCDVELVDKLSEKSDAGEHDPFVPVWSGADPEFTEACGALRQAAIPYRVLDGEDTLFGLGNRPPHTILVPPSMEEKAHDVLSPLLDELEETEADAASPAAHSAEEGKDFEGDDAADAARIAYSDDWDPAEATAEVWSGADSGSADMIIASLRENGIHWRIGDGTGEEGIDPTEDEAESVVRDGDRVTVYVLPEDEPRAKEIIREITTSEPL